MVVCRRTLIAPEELWLSARKRTDQEDGDKPPGDGVSFEDAMRQLGVARLRGPTRMPEAPVRASAAAVQARRLAAMKRPSPAAPLAVVSDQAGVLPTTPATPLSARARAGEAYAFVADGIDRATLRALEAGERAPEASLDLHGQTAAAASAHLLTFIHAAHAAGKRVLHVVHGRGLGSKEAGPVLRNLVVGSLTETPLASLVLAVVSAPARLGGTGAALILLRRRQG